MLDEILFWSNNQLHKGYIQAIIQYNDELGSWVVSNNSDGTVIYMEKFSEYLSLIIGWKIDSSYSTGGSLSLLVQILSSWALLSISQAWLQLKERCAPPELRLPASFTQGPQWTRMCYFFLAILLSFILTFLEGGGGGCYIGGLLQKKISAYPFNYLTRLNCLRLHNGSI